MIFKTTDDGERIISFFNKAKIESENFAKQLEKDKTFLTEYFNATGDVAKQQAILNKSTNEASKSAIEYAVNTKGAAGSVSNFEQQQIKANASIQKSKKYFDLSTVSAGTYKLAIKGITIVANMATSALLSGVVYAFSKLFTAQNEAIEKAKELTSTYKSDNTSLEDYKEQINTLVTELNTSNISYEDSKTKRKELMSIQDELFKKYGTEEEVIKSITAAINGEVDALDALSQKSYYEWLASVDSLTGAQKFGNGFFKIFTGISDQYKSALDSAVDYMEDKTQFFYVKTTGNEELDNLIQEKFGLYKNAFNEFVIKDMVPEEAYELLGQIRTAYRDNASEYLGTEADNILTTVNDSIQSAMTTIDAELGKHQETYHTYLEGMIKYDSEYSDEYADLLSKRALLEEAELSTNDEGKQQRVLEAKKAFYDSLNNAIASSENNDNVKRYFENLYPDLYSEISSWDFEYNISANTDGIADTAKEVGEKYTATDLLNMIDIEGVQEGEESFNSLIDKAIEYGVCTDKSAEEVQKLIDLLVELGIIQDNVKGDTFNGKNPISTSISDTITQLSTQLKPAFDFLKSAYQSIFTSDGYNPNAVDIPMLGSIKSSIEEINKLEDVDITIDMDAFDTLATTLTDINTTEDQARQAFNDFATSIFYATNATDGMTEETKELVEQLLESLGIANATEVAEYALAEAKAKDMLSTYDVINAKEDEYAAILAEGTAAGIARQQLYKLMAAEIAFGNNDLSTEEKIKKLKELAEQYGDTASAALATAIANDLASGHTDVDSAINDLMAQINAGIGKVSIDFSPIEKSASKAGKETGKSYADALKDELSNLNSAISYISDVIDKQIDLFQEQKDAAIDALEAEKEAAEEALEAEKELVQEKIDAKQAEIDAINEASKARKNELDLQKAQYDLERVQNQKTMLAYSESKGMHYVADTKEIRQAKEAATEAKENIQVANMEKDIAGLNDTIEGLDKKIGESNEYYGKLIEETGKYWDSLIKGLEEYKSRWQELADIENQAKMEAMLRGLGITTDDVLNMSGAAFESFKGTYLGLLDGMYAGNDEMVSMLQRFGDISTDTLKPLADTVNTVAGSFDSFAASAGNAGTNASDMSEKAGGLNANATALDANLASVSNTLGSILEGNRLGAVAGQLGELAGAIQSVSDALGGMPTGMDISGVAGQFDALGSSVGRASASISGGDASKAGPPGGAPGNNATNAQGGAYSLVGSIKGLKSEADKSVGTNENSGIIGQFNRLGASVARVSAAVGGRAAEPGGNAGDGGKGPGSLISSVTALGAAAGETLGEPDGEGVAGRFGQLATTIAGAEGHVAGIISKLDELGKMPPAECTIVVNVETRGGLPGGTPANPVSDAIGALGKAGGQHTTKHKGKAYAQGTALVAGDWEAQSAGGKALVGEAGYEIVVRGGRFFTVGDRGPEMFPIQKGDIVFNHRQSVELLERGHTTGRGKAYADGTVGRGKSLTPDGAILEPYDPATDATAFGKLYAAWQEHYGSMEDKVGEIQKALSQHLTVEHNQQMQNDMNRLSIVNHNNRNIHSNATFGDVNIICPGVTEQQIAEKLPGVLNNAFRGFSVYADQYSRIR